MLLVYFIFFLFGMTFIFKILLKLFLILMETLLKCITFKKTFLLGFVPPSLHSSDYLISV